MRRGVQREGAPRESGGRAPRSRGMAAAPFVILLLVALVMSGLAGAWLKDRGRAWIEPRWGASEFVPLGPVRPVPPGGEVWVVPVNPWCPHCRGHLARVLAARGGRAAVWIAALVVDTPKPPAAATFANVAVDGWWWDARDTWRRRWGHRVYGEVMVFDSAGRYRSTRPPLPDLATVSK